MAKFNMAFANYMLDKKITNFLAFADYRTPQDSKTKFIMLNGLASYGKLPIAQRDQDNDKVLLVYAIPENAPKYMNIIRYRLVTLAKEQGFTIVNVAGL